MSTFKIYDKVFISDCPTLKGEVTNIIPADEDQPEMLNVRIWIPEDEPGFFITSCYEDFWCLDEELEAQS